MIFTGVVLADFRTTVHESLANGSKGERRTFTTGGVLHNDRIVIRELMYSCKDELFIFQKRLPPDVYSAAVLRNVAEKANPPSIRILLGSGQATEPQYSVLSEVRDLIEPNGPIQVREIAQPSPVDYIVVDSKHLWLEYNSRGRNAFDQNAIVDLYSAEAANDALKRLNILWSMARVPSLVS